MSGTIKNKLKILHLEDSSSDAELIKRVLTKGNIDFETLLVHTRESFVAALDEFLPDLILSDHSLPAFNSHEALSIYSDRHLKIPFILITSNVSEEFAIDVIKRGADDYLLKDRLERLPSAVKNALNKYELELEKENYLSELIKNERHYRSLIENGADVIVVLTQEGKFKYVSPSIHRLLGYTEDEALNLELFEVTHPLDKKEGLIALDKCLHQPGVPLGGHESRIKNKNGDWLWLEATMTNMLHDPSINGIVTNFRDVTDRVMAEQAIKASEERYRSFFENSMDGILLTITDGDIFAANPSACRMFQMTEEEICKTGRFGLVDKNDPRVAIGIKQRQQTGRAKVEVTLIRKDGTRFPGEITSAVFKDDSGLERTSMIVRDISERYQAEQKILHVNRLYSFISQINQMIVRAKDDQTLFNEACRIAVECGKFKMAWIGVLGPQKKIIDLVASSGATPEQIEALRYYNYQIGGPIDKVVRGLDYAVVANISTEVKTRLKEITGEAGFISAIVLPIKTGSELIATFNIYSTEPDFFDDQEIDLLTESTADISFALDVFEKIKLSSRAEQQLLESENKLSKAQSIAKLGYWELNFDDDTLFWSDETFRIWGRSRETFTPSLKTLLQTVHPEDLKLVISEQSLATAGDKNLDIEYRIILPDQSVKWVNDIGQLVKNEHGEFIKFEGSAQDITARKVAEEELKKTESRYRQIVETAQEGIWLIDNRNRTTFVNKKMCQILEYSEKEMIGTELFEYMDAEGKELAVTAIANRKNGISGQNDVKYISKSGREIWTTVSANPFFDAEGNYNGSLAMVSDITEKKVLEQLLEKAITLSRIGTYEIDLVNKEMFWSAMTKDIHEVSWDFTPDMDTAINFYKPQYRDAITGAFERAISRNEPFDLELEINTAKNNSRWVRAIGEAEHRDGNCIRIYGSFQDIEKVKNSELEVLKAYEEKNDIIESIDDAFFAVDKNWTITYFNNRAESLLNRRRDEVLNKSLWEVYPEVIGSTFWSNYHDAIADNNARHFEAHYETMDIWFEVSAYPSTKGLSVFFKDITERKLSETRLNELNENLQKYADELLMSNKGLEQFSYIISHNLRAPVANIIGLTEILQGGGLDPEMSSTLMGDLATNVKNLDDVILDLNHILSVKNVQNELKEKVSLTDLIYTIRQSIKNIIDEENVNFILMGIEIDEIYSLKSYLHSIFLNLVTNSIKYRRPDEILQIEISSHAENEKLSVIYKDNGRGIDMNKNKDNIFALYKRFHRDIEGKGIGLFMVKTQTELLGGKVSLQSEVDMGVELRFEFIL